MHRSPDRCPIADFCQDLNGVDFPRGVSGLRGWSTGQNRALWAGFCKSQNGNDFVCEAIQVAGVKEYQGRVTEVQLEPLVRSTYSQLDGDVSSVRCHRCPRVFCRFAHEDRMVWSCGHDPFSCR